MALHHAEQHGRDAVARARRTFTPRWHPILAAQEVEPGHWVMIDTMDQPYGLIKFVRRGDEVGYRVDEWPDTEGADGKLIGYYRTLRAATFAAHRVFISKHGGGVGAGDDGKVR
jgi:hypothetical protein